MSTLDIDSALMTIPSDDRDTWLRVGSALKTEMGDAGFPLWDSWSRVSERYIARDMNTQWRSLRPGRVRMATIYWLARRHGWRPDRPISLKRPFLTDSATQGRDALERQKREQANNAERAAKQAQDMIDRASVTTHPYLESKGFPEERILVFQKNAVLPVRNARGGLLSVQTITCAGDKMFLKGGRIKGGRYRLGRGREMWVVEGYATGMSVREALRRLYRDAQVVVAFSAANVREVARPGDIIVADNDESGAGEKYAARTGCRWWMPPDIGDANDYHQAHGTDVLAKALVSLV